MGVKRIFEGATAAVLAAVVLAGAGYVWSRIEAEQRPAPGDIDGPGAVVDRPVDDRPGQGSNGRSRT
jgi:hypothetical protein